MKLNELRKRYLKDDCPRRLGALAANLSRISSFSKNPGNLPVVKSLIQESEYFIEWTLLDTPPRIQEILLALQINLAVRNYRLNVKQGRKSILELPRLCRQWAEKVLTVSGL